MEYNRRTGKTFRRLLRSLAEASEGKHVLYVTARHHLVPWYMNHAVDIAHSYLSADAIDTSCAKATITFQNGGKVTFLSGDSDKLRGLDGEVTNDD